MKIQAHFPVPFAYDQHPEPLRLNLALRELFLRRESEGARYANPTPYTVRNKDMFESHFDLFAWPEPEIAELREFCLSRVLQLACNLNGYDEANRQRLLIETDAWFHVTRRGGHFGIHNHPMASWSGVYSVSAGQSDADEPGSGVLNFINPNHGSAMYVDPGNLQLKPPFALTNFGLELQPGQLLLFPSWLLHHVMPFQGEGERITVAFNCAFKFR